MNAKFNLYERKGKTWAEYLPELIEEKGAWYEMRFGTKYFDNPAYKDGEEIDITVGTDTSTAPTILTLLLANKEKFKIGEMSLDYISKRWGEDYSHNDIVEDLEQFYEDVSLESHITVLEFT